MLLYLHVCYMADSLPWLRGKHIHRAEGDFLGSQRSMIHGETKNEDKCFVKDDSAREQLFLL